MPDDDTEEPSASRAERLARAKRTRRKRSRVVLAGAAAAIGVTLFALVATDVVALRGPSPKLADAIEEGSRSSVEVSEGAVELVEDQLGQLDDRPVRSLDHEDPLRVWVAGDSHVGVVGPSLGELLEPTGVAATNIDYRVSSGLMHGGPRDWFSYAPPELDALDPEVVVFMVGTNDAVVWSDGAQDSYRERTATMMDLLSDGGRRIVLWVAAPPLRSGSSNEGAVEVNRVFKDEADERPEVVYVDAHDIFDDGDGGYTDTLTALDGSVIDMRRSDGIHLSTEGGDHLAVVLYALIDDIYDLEGQADPDNPIEYVIASGSGCAGACGTGSTGGSSDLGTSPAPVPVTPAVEVPETSAPDETSQTSLEPVDVSSTTTAPASTAPPSSATPTTAAETTVPQTTPTTQAPAPTSAPPPTAPPTTAEPNADQLPGDG